MSQSNPKPLRMALTTPPTVQKGRGAASNMQGRFELLAREHFDDGWIDESQAEEGQPPLRTQVIMEQAKSILTRNGSPDVPFNVSLNPYRGCEHGCIYCFARPTHSYLGLSPGMDFESRIYAKTNAAQLLRQALSKKNYVPESIAIGVNTDAYQPVERKLGITRQVLEVLHAARHPLAMITKSSLIERDIDLLAEMAQRRQAAAAVTITTLDPNLSRILEPRAAAPERRLRTIRTLAEAGIPVGVSIAPVIPFITEPDLERVLQAAVDAGASSASYIVLRLPWEVSPLFQQWLQAHFPDRAERVMNRVRDMRGGQDYDASFGTRMKGEGLWAELVAQRFERLVRKLGIDRRARNFGGLDFSQFAPPPVEKPDDASGQMPLF